MVKVPKKDGDSKKKQSEQKIVLSEDCASSEDQARKAPAVKRGPYKKHKANLTPEQKIASRKAAQKKYRSTS